MTPRRPLVAFTAPPHFPDLHDDWPLVRAALEREGIDSVPVVWSDSSADWSTFDLVVANGAWDNIHHVDEFLSWVTAREEHGPPTVNSPSTLRWNLDKRYLRALEAAGVATVPTTWVEPDAGDKGSDVALPLPGGEIVVKPSISGGGYRTARYDTSDHEAALAHVRELVSSGRTAMIQPYQESVDAHGELGLVFLGGAYSHAIQKDPMIRRGVGPLDHLIDNQVTRYAAAPAQHLEVAAHALATAERLLGPTTYARVDVVAGADGAPLVLELELLDPVLFFAHHPEGAATFARVLAARL